MTANHSAPFGLPFGAFFVPLAVSCKFLLFTLAL